MRMSVLAVAAAAGVVAVASRAQAVTVYVMSSGDPNLDDVVVAVLTSHGHAARIGVPYTAFDGTQSLDGFDTVYLQANYNWSVGDMPTAGQAALLTWVDGGGRLVTSEWVLWKTAAQGYFQVLQGELPLLPATLYSSPITEQFTQLTASAEINAGLPSSFSFPLVNFAGSETFTTARVGATAYYSSINSPDAVGLAGWTRASGTVFSFSSTCGDLQLQDANFGRLFANVMGAGSTSACYANCDGSTAAPILNIGDFVCFQQQFAAGNAYANCDGSTTPPVLNIADFVCFQQQFAAGCP